MILDYFSVNWKNINLQKNVNHSLQSLFDSVNDLEIRLPYKKVKNYKLKFKEKSWVSYLQKSILIKKLNFQEIY